MDFKSFLYGACLVIENSNGYFSYIYNNELPIDIKESEKIIIQISRNSGSINSTTTSYPIFDMTFGSKF